MAAVLKLRRMVSALALAVLLSAAAKPTAAFTPKSRPYDAVHYRIDFRLKDGGAYESKVTITLKLKSALGQIELDSYGQNIKDAEVDGAKATFAVKTDDAARTGTVTVKPAAALAAGKDATVELDVEGTAGESHDGFFTV